MVVAFNSLAYILLLLATTLLFYGLRGRVRILLLIAASLGFYAAFSIPLVSLILISAVVDFTAGRLLAGESRPGRRKLLLFTSLVVNLGLLGYFKYAGFFLDNLRPVFGDDVADSWVAVVLPPGISFYTFQTLSYTIDVYRRAIEPTRSFPRFLLYVAFFPQLIAGPIERAGRLLGQFGALAKRRFSLDDLVAGTQLIIWGLFKKIMIADHCGQIVDSVYGQASPEPWAVVVATYAFTLQIYCDFSAYSEIARGSARILGVRLMRNFDQPYLTRSISDFWRRWHISLSEWFRDYVYIPLGGSRKGKLRTLGNLTITMFVSGLWHGAAWNFVLWGLYHGLLLLVGALLGMVPSYRKLRARGGWAGDALAWFITLQAVVFGWLMFRVDSLEQIVDYTASAAQIMVVQPTSSQLWLLAAFFGFVGLSALERRYRLLPWVHQHGARALVFHTLLIILMLLFGAQNGPQFIYFQF